MAVGEAGSTPAAHAYVARNFVPEKRSAPLAVITMSIPVASAASLLGGGLLAESMGWRMAFVVMGGISVLLAPLVLVGGRQPPGAAHAAGAERAAAVNWWDLLRKPSFLAMVAGTALVSAAGYSLTTFAPAFLMRTRGMSLGEVGISYGLATGLLGILGLLIVGRIADRLAARDPRWLLWIVVILIAALLPASALAFVVESKMACVWLLALGYVIGTAYLAPSIAAHPASGAARTARDGVGDLLVLQCDAGLGRAVPDRRDQRFTDRGAGPAGAGPRAADPGADHAAGRDRLLRAGRAPVPPRHHRGAVTGETRVPGAQRPGAHRVRGFRRYPCAGSRPTIRPRSRRPRHRAR